MVISLSCLKNTTFLVHDGLFPREGLFISAVLLYTLCETDRPWDILEVIALNLYSFRNATEIKVDGLNSILLNKNVWETVTKSDKTSNTKMP